MIDPNLAAVMTALAALITAWAGMARVRAEVSKLRKGQARLQTGQDRLESELSPNHGSSTRDAVERTETAATLTRDALSELRTEVLSEIHGMRRDVGRLADSDADLRRDKNTDHARIHRRIDHLETLIQKGTPDA